MNENFYKDYYNSEVNRIESINSRLQWSISIWIILLGANIICFKNKDKISGLEVSYYLSVGTSCLFLLSAIVLLCIGMWGTKSKRLPKPSQLNQYYSTLINYYKDYPGYENNYKDEFQSYLENTYIEITDDILIKNDRKLAFSRYSNVLMIISSLFLIITFFLLLLNLLGF